MCLAGCFLRLLLFIFIFLLAVGAAVGVVGGVAEQKDLVDAAFNRGDAARVFAGDDVAHGLRHGEFFLFDDFAVVDDIDSDVAIEKAQDVEVDIQQAFYFDDIFFAHGVAFCIFDNGNATIEFVQLQVFVNIHAAAGFDVINDNAAF